MQPNQEAVGAQGRFEDMSVRGTEMFLQCIVGDSGETVMISGGESHLP